MKFGKVAFGLNSEKSALIPLECRHFRPRDESLENPQETLASPDFLV